VLLKQYQGSRGWQAGRGRQQGPAPVRMTKSPGDTVGPTSGPPGFDHSPTLRGPRGTGSTPIPSQLVAAGHGLCGQKRKPERWVKSSHSGPGIGLPPTIFFHTVCSEPRRSSCQSRIMFPCQDIYAPLAPSPSLLHSSQGPPPLVFLLRTLFSTARLLARLRPGRSVYRLALRGHHA